MFIYLKTEFFMSLLSRSHFDSLIFDMDGTLWDAVDSYCAVWNRSIDQCCPQVPHVDYSTLASMMGKPLDVIYGQIVGEAFPEDKFMERLTANEKEMMPRLGGKLYPGVAATIAELSKTHRLFMVSNCTVDGLPNFLAYTGLTPYFADTLSFGETGCEKDVNIAKMVEKHQLERPLYIGDTQGDCDSSHRAGVSFAWATYGFGRNVHGAEYTLDKISTLLTIA